MKSSLIRLAHGLTVVTESIAAVLLVAVVLMNLGQICFRYLINDPLSWTEETMRYTMVWVVFLAGSAALFRGEHMVINVFSGLRSPLIRHIQHIGVLLFIGAFCLLLAVKGIPVALDNARQVSPAVRIPMVWPYMAVGAGGVLMLIKVAALMMLPPEAMDEEQRQENAP